MGQRYRSFPTFLWVEAGRLQNPADARSRFRAVALGDPRQRTRSICNTAHCGRGNAAMDCFSRTRTWLHGQCEPDTSHITYPDVLAGSTNRVFHSKPFLPAGRGIRERRTAARRLRCRAQAYGAVLSGCAGTAVPESTRPLSLRGAQTLYPAALRLGGRDWRGPGSPRPWPMGQRRCSVRMSGTIFGGPDGQLEVVDECYGGSFRREAPTYVTPARDTADRGEGDRPTYRRRKRTSRGRSPRRPMSELCRPRRRAAGTTPRPGVSYRYRAGSPFVDKGRGGGGGGGGWGGLGGGGGGRGRMG
jgi:hypothetical protein